MKNRKLLYRFDRILLSILGIRHRVTVIPLTIKLNNGGIIIQYTESYDSTLYSENFIQFCQSSIHRVSKKNKQKLFAAVSSIIGKQVTVNFV